MFGWWPKPAPKMAKCRDCDRETELPQTWVEQGWVVRCYLCAFTVAPRMTR